jgi:hypothetical protein
VSIIGNQALLEDTKPSPKPSPNTSEKPSITITIHPNTVDDRSENLDNDENSDVHANKDNPQPSTPPTQDDIIVPPACVVCKETSKLRALHKCNIQGCDNLLHASCSSQKDEIVCDNHQIPTTDPKPTDPPSN